jgi:hypothetical protein
MSVKKNENWPRIILNHSFFLYVLGAIILLIPALFNGYPLVYSDSGTYIQSGFGRFVPIDRPVWYGLFIQYTSLSGYSLWFTIIFQSFVGSFLYFQLTKLLYIPIFVGTPLLLFLSVFTPFGWYIGQLMPDVWISFALFSFLLLLRKRDSLWMKVIVGIIFFFALVVHFSHFLIFLVVALIVFFIHTVRNRKFNFTYFLPFLLVIFSFLATSVLNFSIDGKTSVMRSSNVFFAARLVDIGTWQQHVSKISDEANPLFDLKESVSADSRTFLWDQNGEVQHLGGWESANTLLGKEIKSMFSNPRNMGWFFFNAFTATLSQCTQNTIGSGLESDFYKQPNSPPSIAILKYFPYEFNQYLQSRQNGNLWGQKLDIYYLNLVYQLIFIFSFLIIMISFIRNYDPSSLGLYKRLIIFSIIINAFITSSFANVYDRLQSRISWVIVFLAFAIIWKMWKSKGNRKNIIF